MLNVTNAEDLEGDKMKKAIIHFHSGNVSIRECEGIEIAPGQVRLLNINGEVAERYSTRFIKAFTYDDHEFPLLPERKDR